MNAQLIYTLLVISLFTLWFVATIICQFKCKANNFIRERLDVFNLIPIWTFFAPNPGKSDYHLLFRDKSDEETVTEWTELAISEERNWLDFMWNPKKRDKKVLADIIQSLIITMNCYPKPEDRKLLMYTFPYIMTLHIINLQQSIITAPSSRQFMLAESSGYLDDRDPSFILLSKFHQLN